MKRYCKRIFVLVLICFSTISVSFADKLPENHAVNGGLTIIPVDVKQKPEIYFKQKRVSVVPSPNPNQWLLIVGVPLDVKQPIQQLNMVKPFKVDIPFHVSDKFYKTQYLTIKNDRKVDPYAEDRERIDAEKKKMADIFSSYNDHDPFREGFKAPSHGPISSLFGLKRVYNKKPRDPHTGLDIASPEGSPVQVVASGKVVDVSDYFFTGNTVIVDHGLGIFSLYAHLKDMNVKKGDTVKQGDQVGTIGSTGRVTGPHLHWSMIMNETWVDPLLFVSAREIRAVPKQAKKQKEKAS